MCGICGFINFKNENSEQSVLQKMTEQLIHRGPDDLGYYVKDNLAFGFTRLSIIDTEGGRQPLINEDGSVIMICNGEIFNYKELRNQLCEKGHSFRTHTDVEVILHLYEEYGKDLVNRLNGQFAFAIYDQRKQILFCARDHVGIAPFFYTYQNGTFVFGSEIKAILQYPGVERKMNLTALDQIMTFPGLISPNTMFQDIYSLENGHYLILNSDGNLVKEEYWDIVYPKEGSIEYESDEKYYIEKLDELLTKAVEMRLQADVPVGFYISGGLDSSMIASKIKSVSSGQRRHSFSITFSDKDISEEKYQRMMAAYIGSEHHERRFGISDILENMKNVIYHCESPVKETYDTTSIILSKMAAEQDVKVVLTGEGADELFAGYVGYRFDKIRNLNAGEQTQERLRENAIRNKLWGDENFFYEKDYLSFAQSKKELYSDKVLSRFQDIDCLNSAVLNKERIAGVDLLHKRSYIDYKLRLPEHLLADHGDRMAFANSVEARYPFLDKDLIEFAVNMPPSIKLKDFTEKYVLKKIAENQVPEEIIKRPKFAFVAPGSPDMLRENNEYINELLSYERIKKNGYFNPDFVEQLKKKYTSTGFKLNLPYDNDLLIIVITVGIFIDLFNIPDL